MQVRIWNTLEKTVEKGGWKNENNKLQYKDSYNKRYTTEGKNVILSSQWKQYVIDLTGADLSSVIGGFFFSVEERANQEGLIFYLDDIYFE